MALAPFAAALQPPVALPSWAGGGNPTGTAPSQHHRALRVWTWGKNRSFRRKKKKTQKIVIFLTKFLIYLSNR